jgi:hypothetical protein
MVAIFLHFIISVSGSHRGSSPQDPTRPDTPLHRINHEPQLMAHSEEGNYQTVMTVILLRVQKERIANLGLKANSCDGYF